MEQKNWSHVRQLFGYDRFENKQILPFMNGLYCQEWSLYQNHFCPSMKLLEKQRINAKYIKKYDEPKTPYQHIMESKHIADDKKKQLQIRHQSLNPFILKKNIEKKLRAIFKLVKVTSTVRQRL